MGEYSGSESESYLFWKNHKDKTLVQTLCISTLLFVNLYETMSYNSCFTDKKPDSQNLDNFQISFI